MGKKKPIPEEMTKSVEKMIGMIMYVAKEQCKDENLPENVLCCTFLNAAQDIFKESVERIVNEDQSPEGAITFIGMNMRIVQQFAEMANEVQTDLEAMIAKGPIKTEREK